MADKFDLTINNLFVSDKFSKCWKDKTPQQFTRNTKTIFSPFRCFALENFVQCDETVDEYFELLRRECSSYRYYDKNNDLYKFKQTNDLSKLKKIGPATDKLVQFFKTTVKQWLNKLTDIELNDHVALTFSNYEYTDVLLCHDDELENRRIAFVLYLTEKNWLEEYGGSLNLFCTDEFNQPIKIDESISPEQNTFTFFEVLPNSYHQVAEVIAQGKKRLSINGWFHGSPISRPEPVPEPLPLLKSPGFVEYQDVITWINPDYLDPQVQRKIRSSFEDESQIELRNFLQDDKYLAVDQELKSDQTRWISRTPFNKRNFYVLNSIEEKSFPNLTKLIKLMTSEAVFLLISQLTGLKFHSLFVDDDENETECAKRPHVSEDQFVECQSKKFKPAVESESRLDAQVDKKEPEDEMPSCSSKMKEVTEELAKCDIETRKFSRGCYTLLHDEENRPGEEIRRSDFVLDAQLFFTDNDWKVKQGGYTCYIAKGEDEEILTVVPKKNSLALVYRGEDTLGFVKYVNCKAGESSFVDLSMIFYEK